MFHEFHVINLILFFFGHVLPTSRPSRTSASAPASAFISSSASSSSDSLSHVRTPSIFVDGRLPPLLAFLELKPDWYVYNYVSAHLVVVYNQWFIGIPTSAETEGLA